MLNDLIITKINTTEDIDTLYQDMVLQFPQNELKKKKHFLDLLESSTYSFFNFLHNNKKIGYACCYLDDYLWVDYFAIFKEYHSNGFGSKVLKTLFNQHNNLKGCFFEVEKINETKINTKRRQSFYEKLGCIKLNFEYFFPSNPEILPFDLFYYPIACENLPDKSSILYMIEKIFNFLHYDVQNKNEAFNLIKKEAALDKK